MNTPEPKRPRSNYYGGRAYFSLDGRSNKDAAVDAWRKDWMRWARREIKRLREKEPV